MLVSNVLEAKGSTVATVRPSTTVGDVVTDLARHRIGALVVSDDGRRIDGIVSERDVVRHLGGVRSGLFDEPVSDIMSATVQTCVPGDTVETIMNLMTDQRIRHVPVVDDGGNLAGIISIGDVVKSRISELEKDRDELMEYITAR